MSVTYLDYDRNILRARSITVKTYLEHGQNLPRARSKHTSSTVKTYLEHGQKHTSITVKTYLEPCQSIPRADRELKFSMNCISFLVCFRHKKLFITKTICSQKIQKKTNKNDNQKTSLNPRKLVTFMVQLTNSIYLTVI